MSRLELNRQFQDRKLGILVPTYNNAATLPRLLTDLLEYTDRIIVVNDGSTDNTSEILFAFTSLHIIDYPRNKGKGVALRTGFTAARSLGYENLITIDSDGQHFADDLPLFLKAMEEYPGALIMGARNMEQSGVPGKSSFGNRFSNFWFWVQTGRRLPDTQSGYRLYPVSRYPNTRFFSTKFEFEIEVLVRSAWSGIPIHSVPVKVYYAPADQRVSHFRPLKDFSRISVLNTFLTIIAIVYFIPREFFRSVNRANLKRWTARYLLVPGEPDSIKAISIGFGVFMGIVPIWGFQIVTALAISIVFKLNKVLVLLASNISFPPLIPLVIYVSHWVGGLWLGDKAVAIDFSSNLSPFELIKVHFLQYVTGAVTLATVTGLVAGLSVFVFLKRKQATKT